MPVTHLVYLHGFRSSPQSAKARMVAERVRKRHPSVVWCCPQLPPSPREAMDLLAAQTATWPRNAMAVVGSSLGGFYATCLAQQTGCKAALLNPAVAPARDLARHIGQQTSWHDPAESFYFRPEYVDELRVLDAQARTAGPAPGPLLLIAAKGDEVLDWREMVGRYPAAQVKLLEGGDHALSDFEDHMDEMFAFLDLA